MTITNAGISLSQHINLTNKDNIKSTDQPFYQRYFWTTVYSHSSLLIDDIASIKARKKTLVIFDRLIWVMYRLLFVMSRGIWFPLQKHQNQTYNEIWECIGNVCDVEKSVIEQIFRLKTEPNPKKTKKPEDSVFPARVPEAVSRRARTNHLLLLLLLLTNTVRDGTRVWAVTVVGRPRVLRAGRPEVIIGCVRSDARR